tara:strand:- start:256 stop:1284 length:1029 start_codon:yes stop_codon:yes gene_type:complete
MAYQQVGTPRFYINAIEWLQSLGDIISITTYDGSTIPSSIFMTLPVNSISFSQDFRIENIKGFTNQSFISVLGHDSASSEVNMEIRNYEDSISLVLENIVNATNGTHLIPDYDGFSIATFDGTGETDFRFKPQGALNIGSIVIGTFYDMPHSPDLSLKLSYDYSGIKTIETKGGASLSNAFYTKPPAWGDLGAWELNNPSNESLSTLENQSLSRSGRKIYDLSFSFLDDGDVFGANQSLAKTTMATQIADGTPPASAFDGTPGETGADLAVDAETFNDNLLSGDNFYSQVIHKTNGGQLPFIFQPDKNDNTNFIIAKFEKGFSFQQTSPGLYSIKCRIVETW